MNIGIIRKVDIESEMQEAYLDYAMSVIVSRALPDVRDGLKPVHRRILYAMYEMGVTSDRPYKKSARIVGEVLGKFHPHGDAAVYEAMARLAQDFSMSVPLIGGQGNFGSIDGDPPAAMRYTEARLAALAEEMLADIDKNTVDFAANFDGSLKEPVVLPGAAPNFLVNGASGIAVGMATNVPPHNLGEVCDALVFIIDCMMRGKDFTVDDLTAYLPGPDFPTGGVLFRFAPHGDGETVDQIRSAYAIGRGKITVQAKAHVEEMSRGRRRVVVTEIPFQANKTRLIERIAQLVREGKLDGISDLRDESDRSGMRIVLELSRSGDPRQVLSDLYRQTPMQETFGINMLALVNGIPRLVTLKQALTFFIQHRQEVVTRRSEHELERARHRAHILEGLRIALDNLDEAIRIIRGSRSADSAKTNLRKQLRLTTVQAEAVLNTPLRRLASLERRKIEQEHRETLKRIAYLEGLLDSPKKILGSIRDDLLALKAKYACPRRTIIVSDDSVAPITADDLIPNEPTLVAVSRSGRICRWPLGEALVPLRGKQPDAPVGLAPAAARSTVYLFTSDGLAVELPVHRIPEGRMGENAVAVGDLLALPTLAEPVAVLAMGQPDSEKHYLCLGTRLGRVKRIALSEFLKVRGESFRVISLDPDDALVGVVGSDGEQDMIIVSSAGYGIRFNEQEVRPMGLQAGGILGIKLDAHDVAAVFDISRERADLLLLSEKGWGKRTPLAEFGVQGRYGQGVVAIRLAEGDRLCAGGAVNASDKLALVSAQGRCKLLNVAGINKQKRSGRGKEVMAIRGNDRLLEALVLRTTDAIQVVGMR